MSSEWEEIERHWEGDPNLCRVCGQTTRGIAEGASVCPQRGLTGWLML
jgi:hypothetical protein